MKYKENETLEEEVTTKSSNESPSIDVPEIDKESLHGSICKVINLRIKILEESLSDLKNAIEQIEDLYNEGNN